MKKFTFNYNYIVSFENLFSAWKSFSQGKKKQKDTALFQMYIIRNIQSLYEELHQRSYKHGSYQSFTISDQKPRNIHKALVRDRIVHHLLYQKFYEYFDKRFISDSYSCRIGKGTHKAIDRFCLFARKVSKNNTRVCFVLKCDIRKFFASIDHVVLENIFSRCIEDQGILLLLGNIIKSFETEKGKGVGLPLGNLTSQLFANVYLNELDWYVKSELKVRWYIRYADDFVIFSEDRKYLEKLLCMISEFLAKRLKLSLHKDKIFIKTFFSGVDFLGYVHFPYHRTLRTKTKLRLLKRLNWKNAASYFGVTRHANAFGLERKMCGILEKLNT